MAGDRPGGRLGAGPGGARPRHRPYPEGLGRWPAAATLLGFAWIELVSGWGEAPENLAWARVGYSVLVLAAQAVYGVEKWTSHGEGFSAYYNLFSRLSIVETRDGWWACAPR